MSTQPILVAGASGLLGGAITRGLLARGHVVRALGRDASRLEPLAAAGAQVYAVDLLDMAAVARVCEGASQVVSTANNVRGSGRNSPLRVDEQGYRNLCRAASEALVERIVHVSSQGIAPDSPVDFFRVKWRIDQVVKASGVPWVLVKPSAFMDIWVSEVLGRPMLEQGVATVFGDGNRLSNYIAIEDVARVVIEVVESPGIRDEEIALGGPSDVSLDAIVTLIEQAIGKRVKRRHVPVPVLRWAPLLVRPFNELAARLMRLGYFSATTDASFPGWRENATRFGIEPISVEEYVRRNFARAR